MLRYVTFVHFFLTCTLCNFTDDFLRLQKRLRRHLFAERTLDNVRLPSYGPAPQLYIDSVVNSSEKVSFSYKVLFRGWSR